jgi:ABC-type microcin C transport system permease subunit YejB
MRKRVTLLIAALVMALTMAFSGVAFAKITPVDTACTNNGGNQAGGQQPTCKNDAQTQESENQNPAGGAPPGHNP